MVTFLSPLIFSWALIVGIEANIKARISKAFFIFNLHFAINETQFRENVTFIAVKQRYTKTAPNSIKNLKRFAIDWFLVFYIA